MCHPGLSLQGEPLVTLASFQGYLGNCPASGLLPVPAPPDETSSVHQPHTARGSLAISGLSPALVDLGGPGWVLSICHEFTMHNELPSSAWFCPWF